MELNVNSLKTLVTGSSRGIGKAIASAFLQEGASVALSGRDQQQLGKAFNDLNKNTSSGQQLLQYPCDFTSEVSVGNLATELERNWGYLDILVCNVGSGRSVPPLSEDSVEWHRMLDINLFTSVITIQHMLPLIKKSTGGSIVMIASICGVEALGAPVAYSAAKSAVIAYVANLSKPLGKLNIRINAVSPGNIIFPGSIWEEKKNADPVAVKNILENEVALRRLGLAEGIADAVVFLASPKAGFITGANLVIDGGQTRSI